MTAEWTEACGFSQRRFSIARRLSGIALALFAACLWVVGTPLVAQSQVESDPPLATFSTEAFQNDLFTGTSTAEIPILIPPGTAGVTPKITLRYNSATVDQLGPKQQGQATGLGWTLDVGGFILRDLKNTTGTSDDTFKVVFGGVAYDLVRVDATQNIYHTKDETFWKLQYDSTGDYWTLITKDGTNHRFGFNTDSKAITLAKNLLTRVTYKYLLDELKTTSGTSVRYSYFKQTGTYQTRTYDRAVYPDVITYAYNSGALVGPAREVRFIRGSRSDWTQASPLSFHELYRVDAIEVRVGGSLVRKYVLGFDYSIDRAAAFKWQGGATGDLTLRSLTMFGNDGVSSLPPLTFAYKGSTEIGAARLASAGNGIGGMVSFAYENVASNVLVYLQSSTGLVYRNSTVGPIYGSILSQSITGSIPVYCLGNQCALETSQGGPPVGYILKAKVPGSFPVFCFGFCALAAGGDLLAGYIYSGLDRYRVISRTLDDGLGWSSPTTFTYGPSLMSSDGAEFRGHASVRATDPLGHFTETFFHQDDGKKGRPSQVEVRGAGGALFKKIVNTWLTSNPFSGVTFAFLDRVDQYECEGQATCIQSAKTFTYDANGNMTQTYSLGDASVTGNERNTVTDWVVNTTNWIHRPTRVALIDNAGATVRERWLYYDNAAWGVLGTRGLVTTEESRLAGARGNSGNPTVTHTYDASGNRTSTSDARGCTTTTVFETSQTFPQDVRTCANVPSLNFLMSYTFDAGFGVKTSETDWNGQPTSYFYDPFGRLTKIVGPLDSVTLPTVSYDYLDWGIPSLQRVRTLRRERHGTGDVHWSERFFDGLGRFDETRREGPEGQTILSDRTFDSRGLVDTTRAPYFSTETPPTPTVFIYDGLGRQTRVDYPDGTFATMAYTPGLVTSTDQHGKVKRKIFDAFNQLVQVDEIKGSETYVTTYAYDAAGSLRTVTNALGHVTQMTYDLLGRKDTMQDPNMGFWTYAYNLGGDLTRQTDARNIYLDFTYDALGRVTTKTQGAITLVTWRYDTPAPGDPAVPFSVGRLTKVVDNSAVTRILGYDAMGRVTQTRRSIDGLPYDMSQTYDALSRITQETFPDSDTAFYNYNSAGWLCSVGTSLSSTCTITGGYVNDISYNARGQKTSLLYANGLTTSWIYHPTNFRLTDRITGVGGAHTPVALTRWVRSWSTVEPVPPPSGFSNLYRGGICVANGTGSCIGGDRTLESGVGSLLGYIKNTSAVNTVPVYRSTCYSSGGVCTGWGLSLDVSGAAVGYLSTVAPDSQSATQPFIQSNGLLLQGLTGTASGYLWSPTTQTVNHTDHFYVTTGQAPSGYTSEGTTGYIDDTSSTGTVALARYVNSTTGHHYYSTINDPPAGFASEATVGYLHTTGGSGLAALYRHYNSTTGDYLLSTSATPPSGYVLQATLGYIHASPTSGGNAQDLTYNYDAVGNITAITDALWTGSRSFTYDDLNRLTQATGNFGGTNQSLATHNYAYDAIGNILDKAGVTYCYGYMPTCSDLNRLSGVKSTSDGIVYTYDANGNMATGAGRTYTWTADNRMDVVNAPTGSAIMSYDYTGIRVKKSGTAGTTIFPFTGYEVQGTLVTKYIRMGNEIIASKKDGVGKLFYHNDHLGGVNVITDATAVKVQFNEYDPWGKVSRSEGATDPTHRFTGQELDPESNIHYYGGRYYDQALGRFISPDPFVQDPDDPQNLNRYSYVLNSPQNYIDPSGYFFDDVPFGDVSGFSGGFSFNFSGSSPSWAAANIGFSGFSICPAGCGSEFGVLGAAGITPNIELSISALPSPASQSPAISGSGFLDGLQLGLDVIGIDPGPVGIAANLLNAGISLSKGDYFGAGSAALAALPIVGIPAKVGRAGSVLLRASEAAARATIPAERLVHIIERHAFGSIAPNAGKFAQGADISLLISQALKADSSLIRPGASGRFLFEHTFSSPIGVDRTAQVTSRLRVVIDPRSTVITSFPF